MVSYTKGVCFFGIYQRIQVTAVRKGREKGKKNKKPQSIKQLWAGYQSSGLYYWGLLTGFSTSANRWIVNNKGFIKHTAYSIYYISLEVCILGIVG